MTAAFEPSCVVEGEENIQQLSDYQLPKKDSISYKEQIIMPKITFMSCNYMQLRTWNDFERLEMSFGFKLVFQITDSLVNEL